MMVFGKLYLSSLGYIFGSWEMVLGPFGYTFTLATNLAGNTIIFSGGTGDESGLQFIGTFAITGGPCDGSSGQVTLKRT